MSVDKKHDVTLPRPWSPYVTDDKGGLTKVPLAYLDSCHVCKQPFNLGASVIDYREGSKDKVLYSRHVTCPLDGQE